MGNEFDGRGYAASLGVICEKRLFVDQGKLTSLRDLQVKG